MKLLKYQTIENSETDSELENHVQQLILLAKTLASEIDALQTELSWDRGRQIDFASDSIDFYDEVERYEIELIKSALAKCGGNQSRAARMLHLKSTTLNAKLKHYGLNPGWLITLKPS